MAQIIFLMAGLQSVLQKVIQKAKRVVQNSSDKSNSNDAQNQRELNRPHQQRGANPKPANEPQRLDAVTGLNQANSEHQPELVALRNAARSLLKMPVAFIGFIEDNTQRLLTVTVAPQGEQACDPLDFKEMLTPRECSICQYTIMESDHLVIPDLKEFLEHGDGASYPAEFLEQAKQVGGYPIPWPDGAGGITLKPAHFYAGATIRTSKGMHVGTFCVVDVVPRPDFGVREIDVLENLAAQAADYLEERALLRRPANFQLLQQLSSGDDAASETASWDAVVIGGGPAGLTAACRLSFQGLKVALVEPKESFGSPTGVSSKVLREVAMDHGAGTSWDDVLSIRQLIAQNDAKRVALQLQRYGVTHFKGTGEISGCNGDGITTVVVRDGTTGASELLARKVVVSTGSKARRLGGIPFEQPGFYDSDSIGSLRSKPSSLFVQGTGIIALEYATIFAEMGVQVSVAARGKRDDLLPMLDGSMRDALLSDLEAKGVEILYQASVKGWRADEAGPLVELELPSGISERRFSAVLSAVGRVPTTQDLGMEVLLEADDVSKLKKLPLLENQQLETNAGSVYVIGDVSGSGLACKAVMQAQGLVDHVLPSLVLKSKQPAQSNPTHASPSIIWAIPELAFVGSSQSEAINTYSEAEVFSVLAPFADTIRGRLKALPASYFLKLVCLRQDGRILGVHVYGEGASELIHLGASLVADGNTVFDLQYKSFPAVTLHEVYRNAAMLAIDTLSGLAQKAG